VSRDASSGLLDVLLEYRGASTLGLSAISHLRLDNVIIICEVEVGHGIVVWILVPVIGDDSLSNSSIVFWLLLVKHDEEQVESGEK